MDFKAHKERLKRLNFEDGCLAISARILLGYIGSLLLVLLLALSLGLTLQLVDVTLTQGATAGQHVITLVLLPAFLLFVCFFMSEVLDLILDAVHRPPLLKLRAYCATLFDTTKVRIVDTTLIVAFPLLLVAPLLFTGINLEHPELIVGPMITGGFLFFLLMACVQIIGKVLITLSEKRSHAWARNINSLAGTMPIENVQDAMCRNETEISDTSEAEAAEAGDDELISEISDRELDAFTGREQFACNRKMKIAIVVLVSALAFQILLAKLLDGGLLGFNISRVFYMASAVAVLSSVYYLRPKLLGQRVLGFAAFLLAVAMIMSASTRMGIMGDEYAPIERVPLAIEPPPINLGNVFTPPPPGAIYQDSLVGLRGSHYPVCDLLWGQVDSRPSRLTVLDLNVCAVAAYYDKPEDIMTVVRNATDGTDIAGDIVLESVDSPETVGRVIVIKVPKAKVRVIAIRGTKYFSDALADAHMWSTVKILQVFNRFLPVLEICPVLWMQKFVALLDLQDWLGRPKIWQHAIEQAIAVRDKSKADGYDVVITGHSLGGGIAQIVGAETGIETLTWSAVGVTYSMRRFGISEEEVIRNVINIKPQRDVVPNIDLQPGLTQTINCHSGRIISCHSVRKSGCEINRDCGDPRGRDMSANCDMVHAAKS